jgi:hypothetical protein
LTCNWFENWLVLTYLRESLSIFEDDKFREAFVRLPKKRMPHHTSYRFKNIRPTKTQETFDMICSIEHLMFSFFLISICLDLLVSLLYMTLNKETAIAHKTKSATLKSSISLYLSLYFFLFLFLSLWHTHTYSICITSTQTTFFSSTHIVNKHTLFFFSPSLSLSISLSLLQDEKPTDRQSFMIPALPRDEAFSETRGAKKGDNLKFLCLLFFYV